MGAGFIPVPSTGGAGASATEVLARLRYVETPTPFTYAACNVQKSAGVPAYLEASSGLSPFVGLTETYFADGVTPDPDNTNGYKFTPTESGLITVGLEFVAYGQTLGANVQIVTKVDIAGESWTYPESNKTGGGVSQGGYGGFSGSWLLDLNEWAEGDWCAVLPSLTPATSEAMGIRSFDWFLTWTPMTVPALA